MPALHEVESINAQHQRRARPRHGSEAKEGGSWKTKDHPQKMFWRKYVDQAAPFFKNNVIEGTAAKKKC